MRTDDRSAVSKIESYYHQHVNKTGDANDLLSWLNVQLGLLERERYDEEQAANAAAQA